MVYDFSIFNLFSSRLNDQIYPLPIANFVNTKIDFYYEFSPIYSFLKIVVLSIFGQVFQIFKTR
jgi:hypothetical protein